MRLGPWAERYRGRDTPLPGLLPTGEAEVNFVSFLPCRPVVTDWRLVDHAGVARGGNASSSGRGLAAAVAPHADGGGTGGTAVAGELLLLCRCVGAAESASEHPLARALLDFCAAQLQSGRGLPPGPEASQGSYAQRKLSRGGGGSGRGGSMGGGLHSDLEALLPKTSDVVTAPGVGITCLVNAEQLQVRGGRTRPRMSGGGGSFGRKVSASLRLTLGCVCPPLRRRWLTPGPKAVGRPKAW
jgi:Cu+-exporting ATPase